MSESYEIAGGADREVSEVRDRILREATRLFADNGYGSTSTRAVVEAAGVTKPTLYYWFQSKETLFLECVSAQIVKLTSMIEEAISAHASVRRRLRAFVAGYLDAAVQDPDGVKLLMTVKHPGEPVSAGQPEVDIMSVHLQNIEMLTALVEEGVAGGEIRAGLDLRHAVYALVGTLNLHVVAHLYGQPLAEDFPDLILDLFLNGAAPR